MLLERLQHGKRLTRVTEAAIELHIKANLGWVALGGWVGLVCMCVCVCVVYGGGGDSWQRHCSGGSPEVGCHVVQSMLGGLWGNSHAGEVVFRTLHRALACIGLGSLCPQAARLR